MFVAEGAGAHGFEDSGATDPPHLKRQLDRRAISILFIRSLRAFLPDGTVGDEARGWTKPAVKIGFKGVFLEDGHCGSGGTPYSTRHRSGNLWSRFPGRVSVSHSASVADTR